MLVAEPGLEPRAPSLTCLCSFLHILSPKCSDFYLLSSMGGSPFPRGKLRPRAFEYPAWLLTLAWETSSPVCRPHGFLWLRMHWPHSKARLPAISPKAWTAAMASPTPTHPA